MNWTIRKTGGAQLDSLRYTIKKGGLSPIDKGIIFLEGSTSSIKYSFNAPGSVLLIVQWGMEPDYFKRAVGGAVAGAGWFSTFLKRFMKPAVMRFGCLN